MKKTLRVPWYPQIGANDCGPTCLAMVLAAHGVHDAASISRVVSRSRRARASNAR